MEEQELIDQGYIDGKKSFEYLTKDINENFNWQNVHKAMIATDWNWALGTDEFGKYNMGIPNVSTIKNHAYILLKKAYDEENNRASGGFTAGYEDGNLYLEFTIEEWSSE